VNQSSINQGDVTSITVEVPPLPEQAEIVRRTNELFGLADVLQRHYLAAASRIQGLVPSILAKGFRGELLPQEPSDEPASVLLERIRKKRTDAGASPKPVKKTATKMAAAEGSNTRAKRTIKAKPQKVAARSGSLTTNRLRYKRK
jgi:type I restriction enzyme, S subunit